MRVVISGATGFIGNAIGAAHDRRGDYATGIATRSGVLGPMLLDGLNIRDSRAVDACIGQAKPDLVYHCAAVSTLSKTSDLTAIEDLILTNVVGTLNMLMACRKHGVRAFVFVSSDKQYGSTVCLPASDEAAATFENGGVYELSKAWGDQLSRLFAGISTDMSVRVARLVNVYGPRDLKWSRIVPGTINRCIKGIPAQITAGPAGASVREYIYIDDAVKALLALGDHAIAVGPSAGFTQDPSGLLVPVAYNIGTPHRHSAADLIRLIRDAVTLVLGVETPEPQMVTAPLGSFEPRNQTTSTHRLSEVLGQWEPRTVESGLPETIDWYAAALHDIG